MAWTLHPLLAVALATAALAAGVPAQQLAPSADAETFLRTHCFECHGGDATKGKLDLAAHPNDAVANLARWSRMRDRVAAGEMPPVDAEPVAPADRATFVAWVEELLRVEVPKLAPDPGRVTVRRLSRTQWENSIRDLFGVAVSSAAFPADDLGYGFDSIGDALSFSTLHLENYVAAARSVAELVYDGEDPKKPTVRRHEAESMQVVQGSPNMGSDLANLYSQATIEQVVRLPRDGVYRLVIFAGADQAGDEPAKMVLRLDGRDLDTFEVEQRSLRAFELRAPLVGGERRIGLAFVNDYYDPKNADEQRRDRNLRIDWFEVVGPTDPTGVPAQRAWLHAASPASGSDAAKLGAVVSTLLARVYRRPATDAEVSRLRRLGEQMLRDGEPLVSAQRAVLQAALSSPHFLFRFEVGGGVVEAGRITPLSGAALASRLSYFLWGSTPDEQLTNLAARGKLADPDVCCAEAERLLADPRAESLATDFAAQWFELRNLADRTPDPARFPGFDEELRSSLRRETELLFQAILREDRDVRELIDCSFTHIDARLATWYGLPLPDGAAGFTRVELPAAQRDRGGVLGHASVLAVTSNPTRTSPVKRGKWILENLLGQPPPPPPPGNDTLPNEGAIDSSRSFREQMAQHRERKECAVCHVRMDTLGMALERYDAIGRYRESDAGGVIDCSGELPGGVRIEGLAELKSVLMDDPAFVRNVAHKLFVYAVGRELRAVDRLRLDLGVDRLRQRGRVTLRDLVLLIVRDDAFRRRAADRPV